MYNDSSSPTLIGCTFSGNSASATYAYGGGMYNYSSSPILTSCTFADNSVTGTAEGHGGGIANAYSSAPTITNCTFRANSSSYFGGALEDSSSSTKLTGCTFTDNSAIDGGGISCLSSSSPTLTNCTLNGNSASDGGGGMYNDNCAPTLTNCTLSGNLARSVPAYLAYGGGMFNVSASPKLTNCIFSGNAAVAPYAKGGAVYSNNGSPTFTNCTFSGSAASGIYADGGGVYSLNASTRLANCILWGNTATTDGSQIRQVTGGTTTVTYSDVQGGFTGTGNIDADPWFLRSPSSGADSKWGTSDDDYGDLRVQLNSPAVDAGQNSAVPAGITTDLLGNPRFRDVTTVPDTGSGTTPLVDMGAYEGPNPRSVAFTRASQSLPESAATVSVTVQLPAAFSYPVTVPFTLGGTAQLGNDYTAASTSITIPAGSPSATISFALANDALCEVNETLVLSMLTPVNATLGAITTHTITILDDDAPVLQSIADRAVNEGGTITFVPAAAEPYPAAPLTYSLDGTVPAGASITPAGLFTWTPDETQGPGLYPVTVRLIKTADPSFYSTLHLQHHRQRGQRGAWSHRRPRPEYQRRRASLLHRHRHGPGSAGQYPHLQPRQRLARRRQHRSHDRPVHVDTR